MQEKNTHFANLFSQKTKNLVNQRFIDCVEILKSTGIINSLADFMKDINSTPSVFNDIKSDRRSITIEMIYNSYYAYKLSPLYILFNIEPKIITQNYHLDYHLSSEMVTSNGNPDGNVKVSDLKRQISQKEEIIAALRSSDSALREANKDKEILIGYLQKEIVTLTQQLNVERKRIADLTDELSSNLCSECRKKRKVG